MSSLNHRPGPTLVVASIAAFMTSRDTMVVTTALPAMRAHLGGPVGQLEWTMNAYYLAFACLLITAGLGDRLTTPRSGHRACTLRSVLRRRGGGTRLNALIAARAIQGAAAAAIMPLTLTVISEADPPETRARSHSYSAPAGHTEHGRLENTWSS